jgi:hypothetical protein
MRSKMKTRKASRNWCLNWTGPWRTGINLGFHAAMVPWARAPENPVSDRKKDRLTHGHVAALIDRVLHHCHLVNIRGNSYRMREHTELYRTLQSDVEASEPVRRSRKSKAAAH